MRQTCYQTATLIEAGLSNAGGPRVQVGVDPKPAMAGEGFLFAGLMLAALSAILIFDFSDFVWMVNCARALFAVIFSIRALRYGASLGRPLECDYSGVLDSQEFVLTLSHCAHI
jgi:hypothetical protein